jgi:4'-phosphopantetheinyl transferase EntD
LISSALAALYGPDVVVESAPPVLASEQLYPDERAYIARAVEARQAQFGTARVCARAALARLGTAPCSLLPNEDRSPRWPDGIRGSIAHTAQHCAVAVTNAAHLSGIGLDLESDAPLKPGLEKLVCTDAERAWLEGSERDERLWLAPLLFSAKEAFYKCQFTVTRQLLGFNDVQLRIDRHAGTWLVADVSPGVAQRSRVLRITGGFRRLAGLIVTTAMLVDPDCA